MSAFATFIDDPADMKATTKLGILAFSARKFEKFCNFAGQMQVNVPCRNASF